MASTSICTCSLDGGLGFGAAIAGGALEGTVDGRTSGVSGAKVVAGEDANLGRLGAHHLQPEVNNGQLKIQVTVKSLALQWQLISRWAEMDHVAPCKSCANSIVDIKSLSEDALGIANVSTMADTAKPCIGAWCEVLNILRFSFWDVPRDDKGVAGTGCNGDHLILCGINPLLNT